MAKLKTIRRRIMSVRATKKITRAMQMVAAVQMRKAREQAERHRKYLDRIRTALSHARNGFDEQELPLVVKREGEGRPLFVLFAGERGLCGGFNHNLFRTAESVLNSAENENAGLVLWGRKGEEHFAATTRRLAWPAGERPRNPAEAVRWIGTQLVELYLTGGFDRVVLVRNHFVSPSVQKPIVEPLLPLSLPEALDQPIELEPDPKTVTEGILRLFLQAQIGQTLLETRAGELAARMAAMDNATKNADEMIDYLNLKYNQARQGTITKEILEVVSGAEAMKH